MTLRELAAHGAAVLAERNPFGQKYLVRGKIGSVMTYKVLDTVVLSRDLPAHGLRAGDLGAVVEVYEPDGLEVEFVTAAGRTEALVTLARDDVRPIAETDLVSVRSLDRSVSPSHPA